MKQVKRKLPIISVVQNYNPDSAINDFIAGVTVGLTVIPQVIKDNIIYMQTNVNFFTGYCLCSSGQSAARIWSLLCVHGMLHVLHLRQRQGHHHWTNGHHGHHDGRRLQGGQTQTVRTVLRHTSGLLLGNHHLRVRDLTAWLPHRLHIRTCYIWLHLSCCSRHRQWADQRTVRNLQEAPQQ